MLIIPLLTHRIIQLQHMFEKILTENYKVDRHSVYSVYSLTSYLMHNKCRQFVYELATNLSVGDTAFKLKMCSI